MSELIPRRRFLCCAAAVVFLVGLKPKPRRAVYTATYTATY
jgi:hypothetical protein